MSIYISNSLYIGGGLGPEINENNPIIGWQSILTPSDIVTTNSIPDRPAINLWNPDTSSFWQGIDVTGSPSASATFYIRLNNASNRPVDYIAIAKHNFGTVGYAYTVQHSTDGTTFTDITSPRVIATNDAIMDYFDSRTSVAFRIRLQKTLAGTPAVISAPIAAHVKMGAVLILQRRIYVGHRPATIAKNVRKINNGSESGQYLGAIITRSYHTTEVQQQNNTPSYIRSYIKPFIDHVNGHYAEDNTAPCTFFFAWRPGDYPQEIVYGWTGDNIQPENQASDSMGGRMKWGFEMECVA